MVTCDRHQQSILHSPQMTILRHDALGITWEHAGLANVVQTKVQHDHTFQPNAHTSMRGCPKLEAVNVGLD